MQFGTAIIQYHSSLILLSETYATPIRYHEDRVWSCLDFVFEVNPQLPRKEKARMILTDIVQKTEVYSTLRRVRAPQEVEKAIQEDDEHVRRRQSSNPQQTPSPVATYSDPPTVQSYTFGQESAAVWQSAADMAAPIKPISNRDGQPLPTAQDTPPNIVLESIPSASPAASSADTAEIVRGRENSYMPSGNSPDAMVDVDWVRI